MPTVSVSIDVADIKQAITFYSKALGCEISRNSPEISVLKADNITIYLLEKAENTNPLPSGSASRTYDRHWTPIHLDFAISDLERTLSLVKQFGGTYEGDDSGDWGSIAYCADPFGNGFCLAKVN